MTESINNSSRSYWDYFVDPDIPWYQRGLAGAALPIAGPLILIGSLGGCNSGQADSSEEILFYEDLENDYESDRDEYMASATPPSILQAIEEGRVRGVPNIVWQHVRDGLFDCNDTDPNLNPRTIWYKDGDADLFGNAEQRRFTCEQPAGFVANADDCNDDDPAAYPNAEEVAYDGIDQDCDGADTNDVDEDGVVAIEAGGTDCDDTDPTVYETLTGYADNDGDGYTVGDEQTLCTNGTLPAGHTDTRSAEEDCDDSDGSVATEQSYFIDYDYDGHGGTETANLCASSAPYGYSTTSDDCDDSDSSVYTNQTYYVDSDGDGHAGTTTEDICASTPPTGYSDESTDCNDSNSSVYTTQNFYLDSDGDGVGSTATGSVCASTPPSGYSSTSTDCDDIDATISAYQIYYTDADGDGYSSAGTTSVCSNTAPSGYSTDSSASDCDDGNASIYQYLTGYTDNDSDGYTVGPAQSICSGAVLASGYSSTSIGDDCDDADSAVNPGETEVCDDGVDNDCSGDAPECVLGDMSLADANNIYDGTSTSHNLGWSVSSTDMNSDGYDDALYGRPHTSLATSGKAFARLGSSSGTTSTEYAMSGVTTGDLAGYSVAGAGDVDGDGVEDLIAGAVYESTNGQYAGAAYLVSGVDVATDTFDGVASSIMYGTGTYESAGFSVTGVGDVNNDGYADVLIGAPGYQYGGAWSSYGAAYLNYGPLSSDFDLSSSGVIITGDSSTDSTGLGLSGGDVNGDGFSDILVGSYLNQDNGVAEGVYGAGRADIFVGPVASGTMDINNSDIQIYGETGGDTLGTVGSVTGDIDGDGNKDIIVCARRESSVADENGACYLFMGSSTLSGALYAGTDHATKWVGTERGVWAGESVTTGDLNADGLDDVIMGANGCGGIEPSSTFVGGAYVFYSPQTAGTVSIANADAILTGESQGDCAGSAVGTGDFNGDGRKDVMVGAPYTDYNATNGGSVYFIYGTGM